MPNEQPAAPPDPISVGRALSGAVLLAAWEAASGEAPPARALSLLRASCRAIAPEQALALPVTRRDHALVALHARSFGPSFAAAASCAACGERLEFVLPAQQVGDSLLAAETACSLTLGSVTLRFRLANTGDLLDAAAAPDLESARLLLLARCAQGVDGAGHAGPVPEPLQQIALDRLDALHEAAEIALTLACPACLAQQPVDFDVAGFLWREVSHAAQRLLDEVHELAWAYGWSEDAILAMSAARRQAYLARISA